MAEFNILQHLDKLQPDGGANDPRGDHSYLCPVCGADNFKVNIRTGKWGAFGCDCASTETGKRRIRNALSPAIDPNHGTPTPTVKPRRPKQPPRHWHYFTPATLKRNQPAITVNRWDDPDHPDGNGWKNGRKINQSQRVGKGKYTYQQVASKVLPYGLSEALQALADGAPFALFVEGEPCVDACRAAGIPAICNLGGSGQFDPDRDGPAATGIPPERLVVAPDRDQPGVKHAKQVAAAYPGCRWLLPFPGTPEWNGSCPTSGGLDIADWIEHGATTEQIKAAITSKPWDAKTPAVSEWEQRKLSAIDSANGDPLLVCDALLALLHDKAQEIIHSSRRINEQKLAIKAVAKDLGFSLTKQEVDDLFLQVDTALCAYEPPVEPGGEFLTYSQSWLLQGLFLIGLNLLVGMPGAGKSRLLVAVVRAFLHGQSTFLQRELLSGTDRQVLIIGTDQDRQQWGDLLAEVGLAMVIARETIDGQEQVVYRLHERITLHTSGGGFRLDADGLRYIRDWCHANHGGLLVIDSLSAVLPTGVSEGDESAGRLIRQIEVARQGNACIVTHHCNKQSAMSGEIGVYSGSGHGSIDRAVSRFVGLGYETHIQNGRERLHEESPRRVITSQKRGAVNQRLIVENGAGNAWDYISTAAEDREMKRQAAEGDAVDRLKGWKKAIHSVLSSTWQTTSAIAEALPADYAHKPNVLKQVQRNLRDMEQDGLVESDPTSIGEGRWRFPLT